MPHFRSPARVLGLALLVLLPTRLAAETNVRRDVVSVPMRDGVKLKTIIFRAAGAAGRQPTLLLRTPYNQSGFEAQAHQARLREDDGVEVVLTGELAQARLDVAAHVDQAQVGPPVQDLRPPAQAAGGDDGAGRQALERAVFFRHEGVAGRAALRHRG